MGGMPRGYVHAFASAFHSAAVPSSLLLCRTALKPPGFDSCCRCFPVGRGGALGALHLNPQRMLNGKLVEEEGASLLQPLSPAHTPSPALVPEAGPGYVRILGDPKIAGEVAQAWATKRPPLFCRSQPLRHRPRLREYCCTVLTDEVDTLAATILELLNRFQKRIVNDPKKFKLRKRCELALPTPSSYAVGLCSSPSQTFPWSAHPRSGKVSWRGMVVVLRPGKEGGGRASVLAIYRSL